MAPKVSVRKSKGGWGVYVSGRSHDWYETKKDATKEAAKLREELQGFFETSKKSSEQYESFELTKEEKVEEKRTIKQGLVFTTDSRLSKDILPALLKYAPGQFVRHGELPRQAVLRIIASINAVPEAPKGYCFGANATEPTEFGWWPVEED